MSEASPSAATRSSALPGILLLATAVTTTGALGPVGAAALLGILGAHEMGHFLVARRLGVPASLPHFIPLPGLGVGTLGAVIAMGADRADRDQLIRIAAAGPLAGFVVAVPIFAIAVAAPAELARLEGTVMTFGQSLLTATLEAGLAAPAPEGFDRQGSPLYMAAWVGLFITGLNLLPMGQLDGGHILHALAPRRAATVARVVWVALLGMGALGAFGLLGLRLGGDWAEVTRPLRETLSPVYGVWALLAAMLGLRHPPIRGEVRPLSRGSLALAGLCALLLLLVFVPAFIWVDVHPVAEPAPLQQP